MRTKSVQEPTGAEEGHEWLSPDGYTPAWHRIWSDGAWVDAASEKQEQEAEEEEDLDDDSTDDEDETETTEETKDERGNETAVPDRDGQPKPDKGSKQQAHGKQGKGGKSKRK